MKYQFTILPWDHYIDLELDSSIVSRAPIYEIVPGTDFWDRKDIKEYGLIFSSRKVNT